MSVKVALVFPGQGAQTVGMGREFYQSSPEAREIFDKAHGLINGLLEVTFEGPPEKLTSTQYCQPAIFTFSMAALAALRVHPKFQNLSVEYACGLSLGEYSALCASGALSFEETLKLVERRSFFMEEAAKLKDGTMAAVIGMDREKLLAVCRETGAEVANFNSPEQIVITGETEKVRKASDLIKQQGARRVIPLDVGGAFHSSLMRSAAVNFAKELADVDIGVPEFPIVSNVDAVPSDNPDHIRKNLAHQITSSVQWVDSIQYIAGQGIKDFLEVGPGSVLKGLIRKINPELTVYNIAKPADLNTLPF